MPKAPHVSEIDLIRLVDGEMDTAALPIEIHLKQCVDCRSRFDQLKRAADAYAEYHSRMLKPPLQSPREWPQLKFPNTNADKRHTEYGSSLWWRAILPAVLCGLAVLAVVLYRHAPQRRVTQLLAKAAEAPASLHGRLQVGLNGQVWYRPAVLRAGAPENTALQQTRALFIKANYNWADPLSARSFAAWRNRLRNKHDEVVSLNSDDGRDQLYRVRTDTSDGVLRAASLTLRADTLRPIEGKFHFEDENDVMMADAGEISAGQPITAAAKTTGRKTPPVETKVRPEDELRVFAALNAIGADAGEPLTVDLDPSQQHVVVSGVGMPIGRQREIRQALAGVPSVTIRFDSGRMPAASTSVVPDTYSNNMVPLRHELESKVGGAQAFQELADRALDTSSSLIAQAHALSVLAQRFPPAIESKFGSADEATLISLRRRHAAMLEQTTLQLRNELAPLLSFLPQQGNPAETRMSAQTSWQAGADRLLTESTLLDTSLGRLLAGSYSQKSGEDILTRLPDEILNVENLARAQAVQ